MSKDCREEDLTFLTFIFLNVSASLLTWDQLGKFGSKVDKGIFIEYSHTSKAYKVLNTRTSVVEEFVQVKFNDVLMSDRTLSKIDDGFIDMQI
ncbi:hypothetical protein CR513_49360, partial [Mucuna pruriens]